jgi:hypothetical protein
MHLDNLAYQERSLLTMMHIWIAPHQVKAQQAVREQARQHAISPPLMAEAEAESPKENAPRTTWQHVVAWAGWRGG